METKDLENNTAKDVSLRVRNTRKEIQDLKAELEKLITSGINSSNVNLPDPSDNEVFKKKTESTEDSTRKVTSKIDAPRDTDLQIKRSYQAKPKLRQQPAIGITLRTNTKVVQKGINENHPKNDSPKKTKSYNIREARRYIRKQREKRAEELKSEIKESQETVDLKKEKLRQLHEKALLLVSKNVQQKNGRAKSADRATQQDRDKSNSRKPILRSQENLSANKLTRSPFHRTGYRNAKDGPVCESSKSPKVSGREIQNCTKDVLHAKESLSSKKIGRANTRIPESEVCDLQKRESSKRGNTLAVKAAKPTLGRRDAEKFKLDRTKRSSSTSDLKVGSSSSQSVKHSVEWNKSQQAYKVSNSEIHHHSKPQKEIGQFQNLLKPPCPYVVNSQLKSNIEDVRDLRIEFEKETHPVYSSKSDTVIHDNKKSVESEAPCEPSRNVDKNSSNGTMRTITLRHTSDTNLELVPHLPLYNTSEIQYPSQSDKVQKLFQAHKESSSLQKSKSEHAIMTDSCEKLTKDTQTADVIYKLQTPFWLQPQSNLNFINTVKRKLKSVIHPPEYVKDKARDIGVQSSLLDQNLRVGDTYDNSKLGINEYMKKLSKSSNEDTKRSSKINMVDVKTNDNQAESDLRIKSRNGGKLELKSFLSHKSIKSKDSDNSANVKQSVLKDKQKSLNIMSSERTVNTDSDYDTSKNIPDISTEKSSFLTKTKSKESILTEEKSDGHLSLNTLKDYSLKTHFPRVSENAKNKQINSKSYQSVDNKADISSGVSTTSLNVTKQKITESRKQNLENSDEINLKSSNTYSIDFNTISEVPKLSSPSNESRQISQTGRSTSISTINEKSSVPSPKHDIIDVERLTSLSSSVMSSSSAVHAPEQDSQQVPTNVSLQVDNTQSSIQTLSSNGIKKNSNSGSASLKNISVRTYSSSANIAALKEPSQSLQVDRLSVKNSTNTKSVKHLSLTTGDSQAKVMKNNSNEIHLKFEAEVHLLNDFNESLKNFMEVEKAFESLKQKSDLNLSRKIYENRDTQTSFNSKTQVTSKISENSQIEDNTQRQVSTTNYSRGSDIMEDLKTNSYGNKLRDDTFMSTTGLTGLEISTFNETANTSIDDSKSLLSTSNIENLNGNSISSLSLKMFEQLIKEEDIRIENLKTIIKIREKSLLDRTKTELAFLEVQRKHLKETGQLDKVSDIRKKQRGIILKHQHERHEMQKLKQMQNAASKERKLMLKEQSNLIKAQLSTNNMLSKIKMSTPRHRRHSGPLKVIQNQTEKAWSETSVSRKSSITEDVLSMTSQSVVSVSENINYSQLQSEPLDNESLSKIRQNLLKREADLQKRRKATEELLKWHQKLLEEEKKISELESVAGIVINQIPSAAPYQHNDKKCTLRGSQLNQLWQNMTGREDKRFSDDRTYSMSQAALEKFYADPRSLLGKNNLSNKNERIGETRQYSKSQSLPSVHNIPEKSVSHTSTNSVHSEITSQVDIHSEFSDNVDNVYTSEFDDDSIRSSSEQGTAQTELNRISSISELIDNFSKIREEISSLSKKTEKDILLISEDHIFNLENSSLDDHSSIATQVSTANQNSSLRQDSILVSNHGILSAEEKTSVASAHDIEIRDTSINENVSENLSYKKIEYSTTLPESPKTSSVSNSDGLSTESIDNVKQSFLEDQTLTERSTSKSSGSHLNSVETDVNQDLHIESTSKGIISEHLSVEPSPTSIIDSETEEKISNIENKLIESLEKSLSLARDNSADVLSETITSRQSKESSISKHDVELPTNSAGNEASIEEVTKLNDSLKTDEIVEEHVPCICSDIIRSVENTTSSKPDVIKITNEKSIENHEYSNLDTLDELTAEGILSEEAKNVVQQTLSMNITSAKEEAAQKSSAEIQSISSQNETLTDKVISLDSKSSHLLEKSDAQNTSSEISEISIIKDHITEEHKTDFKTEPVSLESNSKSELKSCVGTGNEEEPEASKPVETTSDATLEFQKSKTLPEPTYKEVTASPDSVENKKTLNDSLNVEQSCRHEDSPCPQLGSDTATTASHKENSEIEEFDFENPPTEIDVPPDRGVSLSTFFKDKLQLHDNSNSAQSEENIDHKNNESSSSVASNENQSQTISNNLESIRTESEPEKLESAYTEISEEKTNALSARTYSGTLTESASLETKSKDKHIDVKKRVSEILAEANQAFRGDKSPRLQDIYTTTYDILSPPPSSPELDSPEHRINQRTADSILGDEVKQLMMKQLAIEKEIKQIEQQQKEQMPYIFIREIPNKPPPPYTPPSRKQKPPIPLPSEVKDIQEVTRYAANVLHKAYLTKNLINVRLKECNFKLFSKRNISKPCCELLLDLCTQLAVGHYEQFREPEGPSWLRVQRTPQLTVVKPYDSRALENYLNKKLEEYFGFKKTEMKESAIIKWSRKKRDHVDEILIVESQCEETEWINYDEDELLTKDAVTNELMDMLLSETADVFNKLVPKNTLIH